MTRRLNFYSHGDIQPDHWWMRCGIPFIDTDDELRRELMWGCTLFGYIGFAYRDCPCEDCVDIRTERQVDQEPAPVDWETLKERYGEDFVEDAQKYQLRMQQLPDRRA
jgi:hypothetical protein